MSESLNNKTITINPNKLVQYKTKFKSIAVYNDEDYESNIVELINETYEGTSLSLKQESDPEDTNKLYITPDWSGTAPEGLSYIWKIIAADGYSEIGNTDSNITFDEENTKLTIINKANINQFIVVSIVAMSNGIFAAQSDPITIYGLGAAVTYNDWWDLLESEANEKNDGIYRLEDNGNKIVGINADLIKTGALCVGEKPSIDQETGKVTDWGENILYAAIDGPVKSESDPIVGLAGWTVDKQSIFKNGTHILSNDDIVLKSLVSTNQFSPVRFAAGGPNLGTTKEQISCVKDSAFTKDGNNNISFEITYPYTLDYTQISNMKINQLTYRYPDSNVLEGYTDVSITEDKINNIIFTYIDGNFTVSGTFNVGSTVTQVSSITVDISFDGAGYREYSSNFAVLEDGSLYANAAEIQGILKADAGSKIGGLTIGEDSIGISDNDHPNQIKTIIKESDIETRYIKSQYIGMGESQNFVDIGREIYDFSTVSSDFGKSVYLSWFVPGADANNSTMFFITDSHFCYIDQIDNIVGSVKAVRLKDLIDKVSAM